MAKKILVGRMAVAVLLIAVYLVLAVLEFHHLEAGPIFFVLIGLVMFVPLPGGKPRAATADYSVPEAEPHGA